MYQPACELPARGYFVRPTLFTNVSQSSRIAQEEIFGPVLSVLTFRTPAEAIEKANNTPYGLSAGVWTEKGSRILSMVSQAARRRRLGQHVQPLRPDQPVRRLQGVGLRARGRPARPAGVPRPRRRPLMATERRRLDSDSAPPRFTEPWKPRRPGRRPTTRSSGWRASTASSRGTTTTRTSCSCAGAARSASRCDAETQSTLEQPATCSSSRPVSSIGRWPTSGPAYTLLLERPETQQYGNLGAVAARRGAHELAAAAPRIPVRKTYKLYIGGQFPRSESGRSYVVRAPDGTPLANAVRASRKDVRDAVRTARGAFAGWAGKTAMNRGQVLYRVAELMEGRRGAVRRGGRRGRGAVSRAMPPRRSTGRSTAGSGTPAGPTRSASCSARSTRSARRTSTSPSPRRPASSASWRPSRRRCSVSCRASRRPSSAATPWSCSRRSRGRCRR